MLNRMLFRIYGPSILYSVGAVVAMIVLGWIVPSMFASSPWLMSLGEMSWHASDWAAGAFILGGVLTALHASFRLWRWEQGKGDVCHECGGIVSLRNGRYGLYWRCLACNHTHST